jgi:hypothetical protein
MMNFNVSNLIILQTANVFTKKLNSFENKNKMKRSIKRVVQKLNNPSP